MKILLAACNAKYIHSNLAVYSLKAYAQEYEEHLLLREYTINQQKDDILRDIFKSGAQVICFSCYIWNISFVRELLADLVRIMPETDFWVGGPEVSYRAASFLSENSSVAGVMMGEGEETFLELVRCYLRWENGKEKDFSAVRGITYRDGDRIVDNGWREPMDLSKVPFVYRDLEAFENRILYYETSRGCPFSCSYCLSSVEKKLRFRSLDLVRSELQFFLDHRVPQVKFVDRTFNCRHDHAMAIWRYLREHDNGVTNFHFEISADLLQEEELELMSGMRPGLIQLEIGVQSTNPDTIRAIHRKMDFERLSGIVRRIKEFGNIHQHLDLIAGLPYEDYESFRRSFNQVYALHPDQLQLGFLKVLNGSLMMEKAAKYGIVFKEKEPYEVLFTRWLSYDEILKLKMVESMVEIYYNSGQFRETLPYLEQFFPDAFSLYEALGLYYEIKGYQEISHARIRRYEILREFCSGYPGILEKELEDHMIRDLYLREHYKSRPSFGRDQKPFEKQIWEYRRKYHVAKTAHIQILWDGRAILFQYETKDPLSQNAVAEEILLQNNEV